MRSLAVGLLFVVVVAVGTIAHADPTGAHPRMLLDRDLRAAWHAQAGAEHGPVVGAIALCDEARTTREHDHAIYQGSEWSKTLQACLVAWAATDDAHHAETALKFLRALLDDLDDVGDGKGGDKAASRDDGYAIRNLGPVTALAYDWLHDAPGTTDELRARARARWQAWLTLYRAKGYRATTPGTNYHAGYLISATMIAIAEAGEAGEPGTALWREVEGHMWKQDMATAIAPGGVLDGGDWPEGWQYGPLSVAEIALGARIMRGAGVDIQPARWLGALLRRHVYALSPSDQVFAGGDTEAEAANVAPNVLTLDAVALGDAAPDDRRWARGELSRLKLTDREYLLYDALAGVGDKPVLAPRAQWPTWYVATNTGTLYARTRWDDRSTWFVTACHAAIDVDHRHPDAGNFVLSRGRDDVIVDPSPYGSQSTLTSNAPTVASGQLPKDYAPSQAFWSEKTGLDHATQRASGIAAARCDYADQYKFQERASDIPEALRDLVFVPSADGTEAAVVVIDRASTGSEHRGMYLRFRSPGSLVFAGDHHDVATATVGETTVTIAAIGALGAGATKPALADHFTKDCFAAGTIRGECDAARFPVHQYAVTVDGPHPVAVHVISAVAATSAPATTTAMSGDGWAGVRLGGVRDAVVVWRTAAANAGAPFAYKSPRGAAQIVLDAPERDGMATVTSSISPAGDGDGCAIVVTAGGSVPARPLIARVDASCALTLDPEAPGSSTTATRPTSHGKVRSPRAGCCGAQTSPGSPIAMAMVVVAIVWRRRRRAVAVRCDHAPSRSVARPGRGTRPR